MAGTTGWQVALDQFQIIGVVGDQEPWMFTLFKPAYPCLPALALSVSFLLLALATNYLVALASICEAIGSVIVALTYG